MHGNYKEAPGGSGTQDAPLCDTWPLYTDEPTQTGAAAHPSGTLNPNSG